MTDDRPRQSFLGLRFAPGTLDPKTSTLLSFACALMAG
jgi:hypothetical protein